MTKKFLITAGMALIACKCLVGCELSNVISAGPMVTDSRSVKQDSARSALVQLDMNVGDLRLTGGGSDLMNAEFQYNIPEWKPDVQYSVNGNRGTLVVRQPTVKNMAVRHAQNHWDVHLRDLVPMDLRIRTQTGSSDLHLNRLALTSLAADTQTGGVAVDLGGKYADLNTVDIHSQTGHCTVTMTGDYPLLSNINIGTQTGSVTADLSGHWGKSADGQIKSQTGSVTVTLPTDMGVYVTAHKQTGHISATGLNVQGDAYTNDAYGKSPVTLRLNVSVNTGDISLRTR